MRAKREVAQSTPAHPASRTSGTTGLIRLHERQTRRAGATLKSCRRMRGGRPALRPPSPAPVDRRASSATFICVLLDFAAHTPRGFFLRLAFQAAGRAGPGYRGCKRHRAARAACAPSSCGARLTSMRTLPVDCAKAPGRVLVSVDLPAPDEPSSTTVWPRPRNGNSPSRAPGSSVLTACCATLPGSRSEQRPTNRTRSIARCASSVIVRRQRRRAFATPNAFG